MNNLKSIRKSKGYNQTQVAKRLGVTQQTYANYENESTQAPYETLAKLAEMYEVTIDTLLGINSKYKELQFKQETIQTQPQYTAKQKSCIDMIIQLDDNMLDLAELYLSTLSGKVENFKLKKI